MSVPREHKTLDTICRDYLTEDEWQEGFTCSRSRGHLPPHRAEGDAIGEDNVGTDNLGRKYEWVFEWRYI
jgi:hypothetical protein